MSAENDTLRQCEMEPLANSGLIQPHGVLIYIDKASGLIQYVSANSPTLLGEAPTNLLGQDGKDWMEQNLPDLVSLPAGAGKRSHLQAGLDMGCGELDVLVSATSGGWMVEFERSVSASANLQDIRLDRPNGPIDAQVLGLVQRRLVDAVAKTTGYDRVMLYQFHPDWSGEVLAEAADKVQGSYLGLRFPASDIPAIARGLYAQTPYRHIPDSSAQPVSILSRQGTGSALDLTWSDLRSVSPVHMEYLTNMRVGSSFSVSIMVDGKLWGLVACHHSQPQTIPLPAREHAKQLVQTFVQVYSEYRNVVRRNLFVALERAIEPVREAGNAGHDWAQLLGQKQPDLAALTGTTSAALVVGDTLHDWGEHASEAQLRAIHAWCLKHQSDPVFFLDNLPTQMGLSQDMANTCGLMGLIIRARKLNNALVSLYLFRPEESSEIAWAGNPNKPVEDTAQGQRLSPRRSFEKWVEVRHGYSRAWEDDVRFVGQQLRELLAASV
jgi:two-component system, chemotaxis family, sensor kinase Cph1